MTQTDADKRTLTHKAIQPDAWTDFLFASTLMYSQSHTCTHTLFSLSWYRICPLFVLFDGALGSRAAGALGKDMNKWTVLHNGARRAAKRPKQEILHPLSKGLLKKKKKAAATTMAHLKWFLCAHMSELHMYLHKRVVNASTV